MTQVIRIDVTGDDPTGDGGTGLLVGCVEHAVQDGDASVEER